MTVAGAEVGIVAFRFALGGQHRFGISRHRGPGDAQVMVVLGQPVAFQLA
ncbi:MAG: hypothetical protein R3C14_22595 [Caldilineaceae bacterium]